MIISFRGNADKRAVVYPLLYCLNQLGGALLLTDDAAYRRILPLRGTRGGRVSDSDIQLYAAATISKEALEAYEAMPEDFRNVVCDRVTLGLPHSDINILVQRDCDPVKEEDFDDETKRQITIRIGYTKPKDSSTPFIELTPALTREMYELECGGVLAPLKSLNNSRTLSVLAPLLGEILGIPKKSVTALLLER